MNKSNFCRKKGSSQRITNPNKSITFLIVINERKSALFFYSKNVYTTLRDFENFLISIQVVQYFESYCVKISKQNID